VAVYGRLEDGDYRTARGLDRAPFQKLALGGWIKAQGTEPEVLPCLRARHRTCRDNLSVLYQRIPRLFSDLALACSDGRYPD
jgi:hypothetical protein